MNKLARLICATGLAVTLIACGGGDDKPNSVFARYSGDLKCYNIYGTYTETANFAFSEESMTLVSGGLSLPFPRVPKADSVPDGSYSYGGRIAGAPLIGVVILDPAGTVLNDTKYPVTLALTYPNSSTINPYTFRACK